MILSSGLAGLQLATDGIRSSTKRVNDYSKMAHDYICGEIAGNFKGEGHFMRRVGRDDRYVDQYCESILCGEA